MLAVRWRRPGRPAVRESAGSSGRRLRPGSVKGRSRGRAGAGRTGFISWPEVSPMVVSGGWRSGSVGTSCLGVPLRACTKLGKGTLGRVLSRAPGLKSGSLVGP
eukprot:84669-Heterocapsa_arctica.AAC.1